MLSFMRFLAMSEFFITTSKLSFRRVFFPFNFIKLYNGPGQGSQPQRKRIPIAPHLQPSVTLIDISLIS